MWCICVLRTHHVSQECKYGLLLITLLAEKQYISLCLRENSWCCLRGMKGLHAAYLHSTCSPSEYVYFLFLVGERAHMRIVYNAHLISNCVDIKIHAQRVCRKSKYSSDLSFGNTFLFVLQLTESELLLHLFPI